MFPDRIVLVIVSRTIYLSISIGLSIKLLAIYYKLIYLCIYQ